MTRVSPSAIDLRAGKISNAGEAGTRFVQNIRRLAEREADEMPPEVARLFEEFGRVAGIVAYHDLTEPLTV